MLLSPFYGPHHDRFHHQLPGVFTTRPMNAFAFPSLDASLSSGVRLAWHRKCSMAEIHRQQLGRIIAQMPLQAEDLYREEVKSNILYMYTPSNGHYQDHYIFRSRFLWSGGGATQYVTGSSKFVKKSVVSFRQKPTKSHKHYRNDLPEKKTSYLKTYGWKTILSSHNLPIWCLGWNFRILINVFTFISYSEVKNASQKHVHQNALFGQFWSFLQNVYFLSAY